MKTRPILCLIFLGLLAGCRPMQVGLPTLPAGVESAQTSAPVLGQATELPDVKETARAYLDAWKADDYNTMYSLLTAVSRDAIRPEEFTEHYQGIAGEAALTGIDYEILSSLTNPDTAQVSYRVTLHSVLVGDIQRDTLMNLSLDHGQWKVQWDDTLVLPELKGGNYLSMDREGFTPSRANIYDRNGHALVAQTDATAVGLYPEKILPEQSALLFAELSELTGLRSDELQSMYQNNPAGWYLPLGEVSADRIAGRWDILSGLDGLVLNSYKARYYFDGGISPHVVGYVSAIQADEVDAYKRKGYRQDERVGHTGLEYWGEKYLSGKRGGALYVLNASGKPVTRLAEAQAEPSQAIYTTIDKDFQLAAQKAIEGFTGSVVVLERDSGRVLAMASSPSFDPNAFEPVNYNSTSQLSDISSNPGQPLLNRATQGQYPLGSVFKIITMAAALEKGDYETGSTYECGYFFEEIPGTRLQDWTYEYFLKDGKTIPSGVVTLSQALMRSCNPFFYHIGLDFYNRDEVDVVPEIARGFGLGSRTGIEGVDEEIGHVPVPANPLDATNLAIGQGDLLVTPIQVADFVAAIGNGGILYRPQVIEKIAPPDGDPTQIFKPQVRGKLPISDATLKGVQEGMIGVVASSHPTGTAYHVFLGLDIPVAGKTGTATAGTGLPHAWFAGYTDANQEDIPDIAIAVMIENVGEGSDYAAPIFRRLVELYFRGSPGKLYPWESAYYVTRTPDPDASTTPAPSGEGSESSTDNEIPTSTTPAPNQ